MMKLHTFGCSITQGFALPDLVQPLTDAQGVPLTPQQIRAMGTAFNWEAVHLYQPSQYAWPQLLADRLGVGVNNSARRGACTQQIARQCAVAAHTIQPQDTVIVMWTYLSRISLQWPARTTVPLCNVVEPDTWRTVNLGFNKLVGLSRSDTSTASTDARIQDYIRHSVQHTYLDPLAVYDRYYNSLVLQTMTDGFLRATGARVIHLSVEPESYLAQLESARQDLDASLNNAYTKIPDPALWYNLSIDHLSCLLLHDPSIPPAENDMHPSVTHHANFAEHIYKQYFQGKD